MWSWLAIEPLWRKKIGHLLRRLHLPKASDPKLPETRAEWAATFFDVPTNSSLLPPWLSGKLVKPKPNTEAHSVLTCWRRLLYEPTHPAVIDRRARQSLAFNWIPTSLFLRVVLVIWLKMWQPWISNNVQWDVIINVLNKHRHNGFRIPIWIHLKCIITINIIYCVYM